MTRLAEYTGQSQTDRASMRDVVDEMTKHSTAFCKLTYIDRRTAQAITAIVADLVGRYESIETRHNAGARETDPEYIGDQTSLAWDIHIIRELVR